MSKKQNLKEIALHREELEKQKQKEKQEKSYSDTPEPSDVQDDWEQLRAIARTEFPEGDQIEGLTAKQRLTAIAHCLGWSNKKISEAAGVDRKTISRWLERIEVKLFIKEYSLATAAEDADVGKELLKLENKLMKCVARIAMGDTTDSSTARLQLDAFKAVSAVTRGTKATVNNVNSPINELAEVLRNMQDENFLDITDEEEEELFN